MFDDDGLLKVLKPTFFNAAFPSMIVPRVEPGERVRLGGVSEDAYVNMGTAAAQNILDVLKKVAA